MPPVAVGINSNKGSCGVVKTVRFEHIAIKKMPGLEDGLKPYKNLSPQINIITGPNAAGKSSTARAILRFLQPKGSKEITAEANFKVGEEDWLSKLEGASHHLQKDGIPAELAGIPGAEDRRRYWLSLHELITSEDGDLAAEILRQSVGGYDLSTAAKQLGYSSARKTTGINEYKETKAARNRVQKIEQEQKKWADDEALLKALETERDKARKAKALEDFYAKLSVFREKQETLKQARQVSETFPKEMEHVREDDFRTIEELKTGIEQFEIENKEAEKSAEKLEQALAGLLLPAGGFTDENLLSGYAENLKETEKEIKTSEQELADLEEKMRVKSQGLSLNLPEVDFTQLDAKRLATAEAQWSQAFQVRGELAALQKETELLKSRQIQTGADTNRLNEGIVHLSNWLADETGTGAAPASAADVIGILISSVITAGAVYIWHEYGFATLGLVLFFVFRIWRGTSGRSSQSTRAATERNYEKTGLESPKKWTAEEVSETLGVLIQALKEATEQDRTAFKIAENEEKQRALAENLKKIEEGWKESENLLLRVFGEEGVKEPNYASLFWKTKGISELIDLKASFDGKTRALQTAVAQKAADLKEINSLSEKYSRSVAGDYPQAAALLNELKENQRKFVDFSNRLEHEREKIIRNTDLLATAGEQLQTICNRLGIGLEETDKAADWVRDLESYNAAKGSVREAEIHFKSAESVLEDHPLYPELREEVSSLNRWEAEERKAEYESQGLKYEEILRQITAIETTIRQAKTSDNLEHALFDLETRKSALERVYRDNARSIIGDVLVKRLNESLEEKGTSPVLERAKQLFAQITKNRYELKVSPGTGAPEFYAVDYRNNGVGLALDELSTATRIQLILSVRMAFIEQTEREIKLPFLADELLANSDDERAAAIIDAFVEIIRQGRQIFYFTAQGDEVAKWEQHLKKAKIVPQVYYLNKK